MIISYLLVDVNVEAKHLFVLVLSLHIHDRQTLHYKEICMKKVKIKPCVQ